MNRLAHEEQWLKTTPHKEWYGYRGEQWGTWIESKGHKVFAIIRSTIKTMPAYQYRLNAIVTLRNNIGKTGL